MWSSRSTSNVAGVEPNSTCVAYEKFSPVIVTEVFEGPLAGEIVETTGDATGSGAGPGGGPGGGAGALTPSAGCSSTAPMSAASAPAASATSASNGRGSPRWSV